MRHIVDPQQGLLFDPYADIFSVTARKHLESGWAGLFRTSLLELMPASQLAEHFHPSNGRPTKELYSMAGLIFLQEAFNWTDEQAIEAFHFRTDLQFALNLVPVECNLVERTLQRHREAFRDSDLAAQIMKDVTTHLVERLGLQIDQLRLDSTHIYSNMATFGRTRMMGVAIKRFLTQVRRHHAADYEALPEVFRQRYDVTQGKLFSQKGQSPEQRAKTLQQVAEDMHFVANRFADHAGLNTRPSYQMLVRIFHEQCEVKTDKIELKEKTGGRRVQNPSDADATYDGHKGAGYKAQLVETCSEKNDVQLVVHAVPQTAADHDSAALKPILEELEKKNMLPEQIQVDSHYASDENVHSAATEKHVEVVGPTMQSGPKEETPAAKAAKAASDSDVSADAEPEMEKLTIDDFAVDERTGKVTSCPAGRVPLEVVTVETKTIIEMRAEDCAECPFRTACPIKKQKKGKYKLQYEAKERRLEERRREERTDGFKERYKRRAGIESTNSGLKRRLGLGQLRVRGRPAVSHAIYLKVAGWNVLRAVASGKLRDEVSKRLRKLGLGAACRAFLARMGSKMAIWATGHAVLWPSRYLAVA